MAIHNSVQCVVGGMCTSRFGREPQDFEPSAQAIGGVVSSRDMSTLDGCVR